MLKEVHSGGGIVQWLHALSALYDYTLGMTEIHVTEDTYNFYYSYIYYLLPSSPPSALMMEAACSSKMSAAQPVST
jgi:hypothetical protein